MRIRNISRLGFMACINMGLKRYQPDIVFKNESGCSSHSLAIFTRCPTRIRHWDQLEQRWIEVLF